MTNFAADAALKGLLAGNQNFRASRLAQAIRFLNSAISELVEGEVALSAREQIAAERQGLIATFRLTAARAGWDTAKIEEVTG